MDIVERLREFIATDCCSQRKEAADKIEKLREALFDMSGYISRADMHYLKPETLIALKEKE